MPFENFQSLFKKESINWQNIIDRKLNVSIVNATKIKVENFQDLLYNIRWLNTFDDETFLNWFYAKMFFPYRLVFQFYSQVDSWDSYINNRNRNYQRHEQCIDLLEDNFPYTMPVITDKLIDKNTKKLVNDTLFRVASHSRNLIDQLKLTEMQKSDKKKEIDDLLKLNYFSGLLPQLEPGDALHSFLESFNETDSIIRFILEGESLKENKLNLKDEHGIISEFPSIS